jgi:gas vesicle protein
LKTQKKLGGISVNKNISSTVAGVTIGVLAGTAAYMMSGKSMRFNSSRKLKRSAEQAMKTAGTFLNSVSDLIR